MCILTNAHVVADATYVEVRKAGDARKYVATRCKVSHECDLATLTVEDENFWLETTPLSFGAVPCLQDEVSVVGYPEGGEGVSVTVGVVVGNPAAAETGSGLARVVHAEMEFEDGVVMMGCPGDDYRNPNHLGGATQSLYVYVDDVDKHCERARRAGAEIFAEPEDQFYGDRRYGARDPEGHEWYFAQHVRDVPPEELSPPS